MNPKEPLNIDCEKVCDQVEDLFKTLTPTEIVGHLKLLQEVYVQHADVDRLGLANAVSVTSKLIVHFKSLECSVKLKELKQAVTSDTTTPCLLN